MPNFEDKSKLPIGDIPKEKRQSTKIHTRNYENLKIRELKKQGRSNAEIVSELKISWQTFWNRMNEIRYQDKEDFIANTRDKGDDSMVVTDISEFYAVLGDCMKLMDDIIQHEKSSFNVKIDAACIKMEASKTRLKLKVEGPRLVDESSSKSKRVMRIAEGEITPMQALESEIKNRKNKEDKDSLKWVAKEVGEKQGQDETTPTSADET
jgi:hypothetical protein